MKKTIGHIVQNKLTTRSLDEISDSLNMSSSRLQKVFIEWVGISPKQFGRYLSLEYSKELLRQNKTTLQTAVQSGLSGSGRLYDLFVDIEAMTPREYQNQGEHLVIAYSTFETKFGICLVASTSKGICNILFFDTAEEAVEDLGLRWPRAKLVQRKHSRHRPIGEYFRNFSSRSKIKFHLYGTNFQIKVWEALLSIPEGALSTYGDIAGRLGDRALARAVGAAVGNNPIAYIIPCHRVLKSTGEISGYKWGVDRKRTMLSYEAVRKNEAAIINRKTVSPKKSH